MFTPEHLGVPAVHGGIEHDLCPGDALLGVLMATVVPIAPGAGVPILFPGRTCVLIYLAD